MCQAIEVNKPLMKITLRQLEVFLAIAQKQNMSFAAKKLHLSQPACSMALSTLEEQLGGVIFDRHAKRLILNDRGRVLLPKVASILSAAHELQSSMNDVSRKTLIGHLLVGASTTIGNYLLPGLIGQFLKSCPNANVTLRIANSEQIIQQLLDFDIDVGLIEGQCYANEIEVLSWRKDDLIIIAAPTDPLSTKRTLKLTDLHSAQWILREVGSGTRKRFEEAIGGTIHPFLELGHTEAIKEAVKEGLGISCLSRITVFDALERGQLIELNTPFLQLTRHFFILTHREKYQTQILREFINQLQIGERGN